MSRRFKVLASAYACEPDKGSEPGVGWNWVMQIARFHDVWVITRTNNQKVIEEALEASPARNVRWIYFDLPGWARFWKKRQRGIHLYYYLWQIGAYFVAKRVHADGRFDVVHHLTFVNYWMPSFLALLSSKFIWGPVGGGESAPKAFCKSFHFRGKVYEYFRRLSRWLGEHDPFVQLTARRASIALATTPETEKRLKRLNCRKVKLLSQVGLMKDEMLGGKHLPLKEEGFFQVVSVGRLLHWKGFHLGLMAFDRFQADFPSSRYLVIGDGPERHYLVKLARKIGLAHKVHFLGNLKRKEVLIKLLKCHVLLHPSLHESGGGVCMEAMSLGCPVICLDLGGPALQVTDATGIKVVAETAEQTVKDLAEAMAKLASAPELCEYLGKQAKKRAMQFKWDNKGLEIRNIYEEAVEKKCIP